MCYLISFIRSLLNAERATGWKQGNMGTGFSSGRGAHFILCFSCLIRLRLARPMRLPCFLCRCSSPVSSHASFSLRYGFLPILSSEQVLTAATSFHHCQSDVAIGPIRVPPLPLTAAFYWVCFCPTIRSGIYVAQSVFEWHHGVLSSAPGYLSTDLLTAPSISCQPPPLFSGKLATKSIITVSVTRRK